MIESRGTTWGSTRNKTVILLRVELPSHPASRRSRVSPLLLTEIRGARGSPESNRQAYCISNGECMFLIFFDLDICMTCYNTWARMLRVRNINKETILYG